MPSILTRPCSPLPKRHAQLVATATFKSRTMAEKAVRTLQLGLKMISEPSRWDTGIVLSGPQKDPGISDSCFACLWPLESLLWSAGPRDADRAQTKLVFIGILRGMLRRGSGLPALKKRSVSAGSSMVQLDRIGANRT